MARINLGDSERPEIDKVYDLAPTLGAEVRRLGAEVYREDDKLLPPRVREAARMRIAHDNGCAVCTDWRIPALAERGVTEELYAHVDEPAHAEYSAAERLAIEYAAKFGTDQRSIDDDFFARLHEQFSDAEIAELTILCGFWVAFGRVTAILDLDEACAWSPANAAVG
ncbi:MAG: carboxymuconolactone decarboxylase family protein [Acidimicrobiia bacterium]